MWVYHYYYNWTGSNGNANGRYWGMNVGTTAEGVQVAAARYSYDTYANMTYQSFTWQNRYADSNTAFAYDDQNQVTAAYGQGFGWQPWGSLASVSSATYGYTAEHPHAVDLVNGVDRYDYDANGNMVVRSKGVSGQEQALRWDANNRLAQVVSSSGVTETYRYDEHGQRIRKQVAYSDTVGDTVGDTVTYVPFVFYEQAVSAGGSVVTRHYSVNGERVAVRVGGALSYLYRDQVGSTILATDATTNVVSSRGYYAFGATRSSGLTPTDRRFTGQVEDPTGLYYYNSRYYHPQLGQFLSPDTLVPEPNNLLSYNRYLYAKGNPLKYSDPSGHCASNEDGSRSEDDAACWSYVDEILKLWNNDPEYWNGLFKDQDTWLKNLATNSFFDKNWMFNQYETYLKSDSFTQVYNQQQAERAKLPTQKLTYGPTPCDPGLWDCTSLALDVTSLGLSVAQTAGVACTVLTGPLCGSAVGPLTLADIAVTTYSAGYTSLQYASGEASAIDLAISWANTTTSFTPGIGIWSDLAAVGWDLIDPLVPDEVWWGYRSAY